MKKIRAKCQVQEGMFNSESFVTINTGYGEVQSLVSSELIDNGKIELTLDSDNEDTEDFFVVIIPGEVIKGNRLVKLKKNISEV